MDVLAPFRIPSAALKADEASYKWELGPDFLRIFDEEHEGIHGHFKVFLELYREGGIINADFHITGIVETSCDRCSVAIKLPIDSEYQMIIKFGDPQDSSDDVIFILTDAHELNVGKHIYDFILLSVPISHRIEDCETLPNPPCDMSILQYLSENQFNEDPGDQPSPWDDLKKEMEN
jgi:uncharacterized metal-binding protein YceD (DUF177 family)